MPTALLPTTHIPTAHLPTAHLPTALCTRALPREIAISIGPRSEGVGLDGAIAGVLKACMRTWWVLTLTLTLSVARAHTVEGLHMHVVGRQRRRSSESRCGRRSGRERLLGTARGTASPRVVGRAKLCAAHHAELRAVGSVHAAAPVAIHELQEDRLPKWLRQVVVHPSLEALDPVGGHRERGQRDDWHMGLGHGAHAATRLHLNRAYQSGGSVSVYERHRAVHQNQVDPWRVPPTQSVDHLVRV